MQRASLRKALGYVAASYTGSVLVLSYEIAAISGQDAPEHIEDALRGAAGALLASMDEDEMWGVVTVEGCPYRVWLETLPPNFQEFLQ